MIDRWCTPVWKSADGNIETLERVPVGHAPFKESDLRDLLAQKPSLLPVRHFDPVFSSPVCLGTEFPVPGGGRIDALFLSPSGYVTLVETKLWQNSEARREVVAQTIDYAQQMARWTYTDLESRFKTCQETAQQPAPSLFSHVCDPDDGPAAEAAFIDAVNRCLGYGRFLLLIIGDGIREGVEQMTEVLQRTPLLQYTLGLVEMSCYRHRDQDGGVLVIPQIIARTAEVTRAVVHIDLQGGDAGGVTVTGKGPDGSTQARPVNHLSEQEFYVLLVDASSPDAARRWQACVERLVTEHEALEVTCTPRRLRIKVQPPGHDDHQFCVLEAGTNGRIRTTKGWLDFLAANLPTRVLESFLDGLSSIDARMRPQKTSTGVFTVAKSTNAADLVTIMPKLDELATVVAEAVGAVESGSTE